MGAAFDDALDDGLLQLGLQDLRAASPLARLSYEAHARLLREWGAVINLTAIHDPAEVARRHVCDSLSAVPCLTDLGSAEHELLDLGSGAGYPGLPLAAALPFRRVALLDSVGKKARFMAVAAEAAATILGSADTAAPQIESIAQRAEDLAEDPEHRGGWQVVTARAVGSLSDVVELGMPLARQGGFVVAWKREGERDKLRDELRDAGPIIRACGGGRPEVITIDAPSLSGHRLVIIPKERTTPPLYPRPVAKRPRRKR